MTRLKYSLAVVASATLLAPGLASAQRSTPVTLVNQLQAEVQAQPVSGIEPVDVVLEATVAGGTPPYTYSWSLGDGGTSSAPSVIYTYTGAGTYKPVLRITDGDGNETLSTTEIVVEPDRTPAVAVSIEPTQGIGPLRVLAQPRVTSGNPPFSYSWFVNSVPASNLESPTFDLTSSPPFALYEIELQLTDANGDIASTGEFVTVEEDQPTSLAATASISSGPAPLTVEFAPGLVGGNPPVSFYWEFGEGTSSPLAAPAFVFQDPAVYLVTVQATDANGDQASTLLVINVTAPTP